MRKLLTTLALTVSMALASGGQNPLDELSSQAKKVQSEAQEIALMLKAKQPDLTKVNEKLSIVEQHALEVKRLVDGLESQKDSWDLARRERFETLKTTAQVLNIFVENKKTMLAEGKQSRSLLRAKAEGIAKRAENIRLHADKLRG